MGLGKLGLPCALAIEAAGHEVRGWDENVEIRRMIAQGGPVAYVEEGASELLTRNGIIIQRPGGNPTADDKTGLEEWADLVFVAVQTPHQPQFEGITPLPEERADFDYTALRAAVDSVKDAELVVVISTVLPGTVERELYPLDATLRLRLLYNPFFIAMGTTIPDFLDPEFVLVGTDGAWPEPLLDLYRSLHRASVYHHVTTVRTAELTKVAYNTFIGLKIAFANTMMELCEKTGADVDSLVDALAMADRRIISPAYMRGGMGDGGGCHPRDNIALSWLAREVGLSYDLFSALMECREKQSGWLASLLDDSPAWKPLELLGKAYKPNTALTVGSPALLLAHQLREMGVDFRHSDPYDAPDADPAA